MFRMTDHPIATWPTWLLFYPPRWLWWMANRLPIRLRLWIVDRIAEAPGLCPSRAVGLTVDGSEPWGGLSARTCEPDSCYNSGPCYCGRYQSHRQWAEDMNRATIRDPIGEFEVVFADKLEAENG